MFEKCISLIICWDGLKKMIQHFRLQFRIYSVNYEKQKFSLTFEHFSLNELLFERFR